MLRIAGQTARPIGLNFLWTLRGGQGVLKANKSIKKNSTGNAGRPTTSIIIK